LIPQTNETDARIVIDEQLRAAGWNPADKSQVLTEFQISGYAPGVVEPGAHSAVLVTRDGDFLMAVGRADYVLLDSRGRPLAIIDGQARLAGGHESHPLKNRGLVKGQVTLDALCLTRRSRS